MGVVVVVVIPNCFGTVGWVTRKPSGVYKNLCNFFSSKRINIFTRKHTHTHTHTQPFNCLYSGTTRVGWYQKKHSPTHTHPDHRTYFINFLHLLRSTASSVFSLRARQSSRTTSLQVLFGLPLGLGPSTSYSIHFFPSYHLLFAAHVRFTRKTAVKKHGGPCSVPRAGLSHYATYAAT